MTAPARFVVDACVLFPQLLRTIVIGAAEAGLIIPFWSPRILDEWRIASARQGGMAAEGAMRTAEAGLAGRFPDALCAPDPGVERNLRLPDPADTHVVAAAVAAGADILTLNLRDFPARRLGPFGVGAFHPDAVLRAMHDDDPGRLGSIVADALAILADGGGGGGRRALRKAGLPRLGKALYGG